MLLHYRSWDLCKADIGIYRDELSIYRHQNELFPLICLSESRGYHASSTLYCFNAPHIISNIVSTMPKMHMAQYLNAYQASTGRCRLRHGDHHETSMPPARRRGLIILKILWALYNDASLMIKQNNYLWRLMKGLSSSSMAIRLFILARYCRKDGWPGETVTQCT